MDQQDSKFKLCEECNPNEAQENSLKQRIWQHQIETYREIYLNSDIDDSVIEMVVCQIQNINKHDDDLEDKIVEYQREPIKLFINSYGGEIDSAFSVISAIEVSRTPVHTIALGKAMSAGFLILIAGHVRYAQRYSTLLYHQGSSGYIGKMQDILEHADYLENLQAKVQRYVMDVTSITQEDLDENLMRKFDGYLTPEECLEYGCIDGIWGFDLPGESEAQEADPDNEVVDCRQCEYYDKEDPCKICKLIDEE